jgi:signal transduction histidine kinase
MDVDTDADVLRLREGLRDLVALSAIPAVWIGSEPPAVAAGLADVLVGLLRLDFAFVRLSDPGGAGAVEVTRGSAWRSFPEWLEGLATSAPFPRKEVVPDIGDDSPRRGLVVPVGVSGEGGVVAAASERSDFPTPMDQLLLSLAANHAAAAFQSARLIHERKRAEEALRQARNELEVKVAERTAELRRSEAYLAQLAEEQAALRRVATLVAQGASPAAVFDAVAAAMERLLGADGVTLSRYEPGDEVTVVAHIGADASLVPPGTRASHEGENVTSMVRCSGRPARLEHYEGTHGAIAELVRELGMRASVAAPIVVEGRLWGVTIANWRGEESPPADTESRMAHFAGLLGTAIANADSRDQLMASRARLVAASDEARRRFERDLHDGIQQRLVSLSLELRGAEGLASSENTELVEQLSHVGDGLAEALDELRELSRGIHPAILSEGGLVPALKALARRSSVPVELDLTVDERLADNVEVGAYYVVSEALTNAAKHAQASRVEVHAWASEGVLEVTIGDDGVGGADSGQGSGLTGLADRVEALGGTIAIASPHGEGTSLRVELPLGGR